MKIQDLLEAVQKTNPDMTLERLKEELSRSANYVITGLVLSCKNDVR